MFEVMLDKRQAMSCTKLCIPFHLSFFIAWLHPLHSVQYKHQLHRDRAGSNNLAQWSRNAIDTWLNSCSSSYRIRQRSRDEQEIIDVWVENFPKIFDWRIDSVYWSAEGRSACALKTVGNIEVSVDNFRSKIRLLDIMSISSYAYELPGREYML